MMKEIYGEIQSSLLRTSADALKTDDKSRIASVVP